MKSRRIIRGLIAVFVMCAMMTMTAWAVATPSVPPPVLVDSITIKSNIDPDATSATLLASKTLQLGVVVTPTNATNKKVKWSISCDTTVAGITSGGLVSAKPITEPTLVTVTAEAYDEGKVSATFDITIMPRVQSVQLFKAGNPDEIVTGQTLTATKNDIIALDTQVLPANAQQDVKWSSSNSAVATVDSNGVVTVLGSGISTINAVTIDGSAKSAAVKVRAVVLADGVEISGRDGGNKVRVKSTLPLKATVTPDEATNKNVSWKIASGAEYAKISPSGVVTGLAAGTAYIQATTLENGVGGQPIKSSLFEVVVEPLVSKVVIRETGSSTPITGTTLRYKFGKDTAPFELSADAILSGTELSDEGITWRSSNAKIATVEDGTDPSDTIIRVVGKGRVTISATAKDGSNVKGLIIIESVVEVNSVTITGPDAVALGKYIILKAEVAPKEANNKRVIWLSSNPSIATISSGGQIKGLKAGSVTITATAQDGSYKRATKTIVVEPIVSVVKLYNEANEDVTGVTKDIIANSQEANTPFRLKAVGTMTDGNEKNDVTWQSSNRSVATVDANGLVTILKHGKASIKARAIDGSQKYATFKLNVILPVEGINITGDQNVATGKYIKLKAQATPATATNKKVYWTSSDTNIAKIDRLTGKVQGIASGTVTLKATAADGSGISETYQVKVTPTVQSVVILHNGEYMNGATLTKIFNNGETLDLSAQVSPSTAVSTVNWRSSNSRAATINGVGEVTVTGSGKTTITAISTDGSNQKATFTLNVVILVDSITLPSSQEVAKGKSVLLEKTLLPTKATNKRITWTSDNPSVATVTSSGTVRGIAQGTANIQAVAADGSGVSATCSVLVVPLASKVTLLKDGVEVAPELTIRAGIGNTSITLVSEVYPSDANQTVTWKSSNKSIATVSDSGVVQIHSQGLVTISAMAVDGSVKRKSVRLTIE